MAPIGKWAVLLTSTNSGCFDKFWAVQQPILEKFLPDEEATIAFGLWLSRFLQVGDIVKLTGCLGAGKSTFVRGFVQGMGGNSSEVRSPTFNLVHSYSSEICPIIHCDFYRLPKGSALEELGGLELFELNSISFIEWPDQTILFQCSIPNRLLSVDLQHDAGGRIVRIYGDWQIVDQFNIGR